MNISSYLDEKIVNFEKTNYIDPEISDGTHQIEYGEVKMGSTKSGLTALNDE